MVSGGASRGRHVGG
ncbi:hypothetical protein E2C01_087175 [Portunus trituberculatus]|uniref:Uncharacterized protein n=1 Tax=Portunus trituberculatus TaxID=210409 RepID=A0A5B7JCM7_PORTR|nr:hypothetical protein [Portunus trituberculatus]